MIRIQKTKNILGILFFSLLSVSCQEWLDVSPSTEVKYDDLFSYKNGFKDQLTGVYTALCSEELYGAHLGFGMLDALGQQYYWNQEAGTYYYLHRFVYDNPKSEEVINSIWNNMYNAIANVNILLQGIEDHRGILAADEEKIYEGEAYALRAFLHFDLLRLFGKSYVSGAGEKAIPYVSKISKEITPLSTVSEVLDSVITDLEKAAFLLENDPVRTGEATTSFLGTRSFHFNYYAVRALMARVYLYKNDKVNALKNATEVILSHKYPWVEKGQVATTTRDNRDGIFLTECILMLNNTRLETITETYLKKSENNTVGNLLVTQAEVRDEIFENTLYGGSDWRYIYYFEPIDSYYVNTKLWQVSSSYNNRQPLLRISEMYLIAAECAGSKKEALEYFNTLRQHRGFEVTDDLKEEDLENGLYSGYINALGDPYSVYYDEEQTKSLQESTSGEYSGIGVVFSQNQETKVITAVQVYENSPANEAGIQVNDILYKVGDKDVSGTDLSDVVQLIRGVENTTVDITVLRGDDAKEVTMTVTRRKIQVETVKSEMKDDQIGYIRVTEFDSVTYDQFKSALGSLEDQGMKGLVVDLRANPGGNLATVTQMLDLLLPKGTIVSTKDKSGHEEVISSDDEHQFTKPMSVVVDGNSASASEIFAGAIQDYGLGSIVGTTTYGKGIVQQIFDLGDGTCVKLTMAEYYTPNGRNIHKKGITPDVEVEYQQDENNPDADNQLDAALEQVRNKINQ